MSVVQGPQKVSHLAQIETATNWSKAEGYKLVGSFEDLGVSAEKRPEDRPDLGPWLTDEGAAKWDVIVWSKMDRAFRSTRHCVDFARWAEERRKVVAFADEGPAQLRKIGQPTPSKTTNAVLGVAVCDCTGCCVR